MSGLYKPVGLKENGAHNAELFKEADYIVENLTYATLFKLGESSLLIRRMNKTKFGWRQVGTVTIFKYEVETTLKALKRLVKENKNES